MVGPAAGTTMPSQGETEPGGQGPKNGRIPFDGTVGTCSESGRKSLGYSLLMPANRPVKLNAAVLLSFVGEFSCSFARHRQVLRDGVTEQRAEHTDIVAAPVSHANDGLGIDLICDSKPRRELLPIVGGVSVHADAAVTRNPDHSFGLHGETTVALAVDAILGCRTPNAARNSRSISGSRARYPARRRSTGSAPPLLRVHAVDPTYRLKEVTSAKRNVARSKPPVLLSDVPA